ncbi:hypothetical protein DSC45_15265 [Streptomyces sp. YIM 130001]|nr:hypothetical protein DSC45_15265 [Streptomyces sp. YIM 130001]
MTVPTGPSPATADAVRPGNAARHREVAGTGGPAVHAQSHLVGRA